jgi:hypothetical protein
MPTKPLSRGAFFVITFSLLAAENHPTEQKNSPDLVHFLEILAPVLVDKNLTSTRCFQADTKNKN